jgi:hypothetical protein
MISVFILHCETGEVVAFNYACDFHFRLVWFGLVATSNNNKMADSL